MRLSTLIACCALLAPAQTLTLEKSIQVRQLSDLRFSPDGARVAFTVQESPSGSRAESHIWVFDTKTHSVTQWTRSPKSERLARWSPDGRSLAFLSDREDNNQIWLAPVQGGEAVRLTTGKHSIQSFQWSPDGKRIVFPAAEPKSAELEKREKDLDDADVADSPGRLTPRWILHVSPKDIR